MRIVPLVFVLLCTWSQTALAQGGRPAADPADVATLDDIIRVYYEVVSGPAGESANRARDQTLHLPDALVGVPGQDEDGKPILVTMTLDDYHDQSQPDFLAHRSSIGGLTAPAPRLYGSIVH